MRWAALLVAFATSASAQELGHKVLGSLGIDAGVQSESGLYLASRFQYYASTRLEDRNGNRVPIRGLDLNAIGANLGVGVTFKYRQLPYLSMALAVPIARISLNSDDPNISMVLSGLGDVYVEPLQMGWRLAHVDLVAAWSFYAPSGRFEPRGSVGRGQWTQELSWGGALFLDGKRRIRASALASWDRNGPKRNLDLVKGDTLHLQGGLGATVFRMLDLGVAGYALWQLTDDRGADVPLVLRGVRDRVFGVGPELGLMVKPLRSRLSARYQWDVSARSRPLASVLTVSLSVLAWR
jgi:hypothetical protein